ncbi:MAG TPA: ATP-binding protein [Candidatus Xenobia bacterium]|jgi:PAS domain S-box-containing protein
MTEMTETLPDEDELNRQIVANLQDGLIVLDSERRYRAWNKGMEAMSGLPASQVLGRRPEELFPFLKAAGAFDLFDRALAGETVSSDDFPYEVPGTGRKGWSWQTMAPLRNHQGDIVGIIITVREVTQRRRTEEQLQQAQKLDLMGRVASGLAHDFNNLLTVVQGNLELAQLHLDDAPVTRKCLQEATAAAERATGLARRLLAFSRPAKVDYALVDLNVVVSDALPMFATLAGARTHVQTHLTPLPAWVRAATGQIGQVLMNLVVNARDALPAEGGSIVLETSRALMSPLEHPAVCLSVTDNGHGMDAETQARIFEPFFTTKGSAGTGLGLSVIDTIVRHHGGTIEVQSEPGHGSCFRVWLPQPD